MHFVSKEDKKVCIYKYYYIYLLTVALLVIELSIPITLIIMFYKLKPAVFQVIQYTGENKEEVMDFLPDEEKEFYPFSPGDYITKDKNGIINYHDKEDFEQEFEKA